MWASNDEVEITPSDLTDQSSEKKDGCVKDKKRATRKTLPKDIDELLDAAAESDDYGAVYEALQQCLPDARGGYGKGTLLMNGRCTVELARWAIERGTDNSRHQHLGLHGPPRERPLSLPPPAHADPVDRSGR